MKRALRLLVLAALVTAHLAAQTVYWSRIERMPAAIDALDALTPAADKIPYFTNGTTAGLITVGGNLSLLGGTLNLSATPNIGAATGTSLVTTGNITTGGGGLIGAASTLALTGSGSSTFRVDVAPSAANSSGSFSVYNQPIASAGTASYARFGLLSGTNSRDLKIDTGGNGGATAGNIEIAPGGGTTSVTGILSVSGALNFQSNATQAAVGTLLFANGSVISGTTGGSLSLNVPSGTLNIGSANFNSGGFLVSNGNATINSGSRLIVNDSTASTNSTTGAVTVAGGVGVAGALNVAGAIAATGTSTNTFGGSVAVSRSVNGGLLVSASNSNSGTSATSALTSSNGAYSVGVEMPGQSYTTVGPRVANRGYVYSDGAGGLTVHAVNGALRFWTGNTGTERATISASGDAVFNGNLTVSGTQNTFALPTTASALSTNSTLTFELTSNTSLKVIVRGSDGTTRSATLTLAP